MGIFERGNIRPVNFDGILEEGNLNVVVEDVLESEDKTNYAVKFRLQDGPLGNDGQKRAFWVDMSREDFLFTYQVLVRK